MRTELKNVTDEVIHSDADGNLASPQPDLSDRQICSAAAFLSFEMSWRSRRRKEKQEDLSRGESTEASGRRRRPAGADKGGREISEGGGGEHGRCGPLVSVR